MSNACLFFSGEKQERMNGIFCSSMSYHGEMMLVMMAMVQRERVRVSAHRSVGVNFNVRRLLLCQPGCSPKQRASIATVNVCTRLNALTNSGVNNAVSFVTR